MNQRTPISPVTEKRRKRSYPLVPKDITEDCWFYYGSKGMQIVMRARSPGGEYRATAQAFIPWRTVVGALSVHRRVQAERTASKAKRNVR